VFICPHLRLKKDNFVTADDKGLTLINADAEKRDRNNSDANRFKGKNPLITYLRSQSSDRQAKLFATNSKQWL
jgi:hypothetical protein